MICEGGETRSGLYRGYILYSMKFVVYIYKVYQNRLVPKGSHKFCYTSKQLSVSNITTCRGYNTLITLSFDPSMCDHEDDDQNKKQNGEQNVDKIMLSHTDLDNLSRKVCRGSSFKVLVGHLGNWFFSWNICRVLVIKA